MSLQDHPDVKLEKELIKRKAQKKVKSAWFSISFPLGDYIDPYAIFQVMQEHLQGSTEGIDSFIDTVIDNTPSLYAYEISFEFHYPTAKVRKFRIVKKDTNKK